MPLRLLRHSELNLSAWDTCVNQAEQVVPYAQNWWLQATAGRWDAVVEIGRQGEYLAVLALPFKRRPWGREVYQPPFTQQLGLLTTAGSQHFQLPDYLLEMQRQYNSCYLQLHTEHELASAPLGFKLTERITYHLPLAPSYAMLHAGYAADYRRRLRINAEAAQPLVIIPTVDAEPLLTLFQQTKGAAAGLGRTHYAKLRQLIAAGQQHKQATLLEVRHPETGELLAGALFMLFRTRLVYLFAAASEAGKKASAPLLLLDAAIQQYAGTSGLVLDFEGGMIPSIARFFANFGAVPVPYAALSLTQRPWYLQWIR
ncbi:GNAT family N-acetyltransferase [Hymenobacter norwichensis]|uniref:GNAT family N-acetyltransferase n=1 Tax=Hymenobacter norwichensis TaxID=223903 RepID=UPI0003B68322|nr:GNAT family N-acetyltransferase [Hymenobacter norwichensis]